MGCQERRLVRTKVQRSESTIGTLGSVEDQDGEKWGRRISIKLETGFIYSWIPEKVVDWEDIDDFDWEGF